MKTTLLLLLLISINVFSQSDYKVDKNATIYAVPGGELLTAVVKNDTIFVKHIAANGQLIWEDNLIFSPQLFPIYLNEITRFKNTDDYVISVVADFTPQTPYIQNFQTDTLIYEFTKFNLTSHLFTGNVVDTFSCYNIHLVEIGDTSMYLIAAENTQGEPLKKYTTYALNSSMEMNLVAPSDSMSTVLMFWKEYVFDDTIFRLHSVSNYLVLDKFTTDISFIESLSISTSTVDDFNSIFFREIVNKDSLLVITLGETNSNYSRHWQFKWLDLSLNNIHEVEIEAPRFAIDNDYYQLNFDNIEIDQVNKRILILGTYWPSATSTDTPQKLFLFDFDFNLICEISMKLGDYSKNSLISLHDLVYLRVSDQDEDLLYRLGCHLLGMDQIESNFSVEIYPNPATTEIYVSNPESKLLTIELITLEGKQISKTTEQSSFQTLDLTDLQVGIYLIKISDGIHTSIKRFAKV